MIVKGHDFPYVTLMGVIAADLSLHTADFRAAERTFQLITQAAGRAGRGTRPGEVVIQTYQPEHYAVVHAAIQDYDGFYELEIQLRKLQSMPPFGDLVSVTYTGQEEAAVLRGSAKFRDSLTACLRLPEYRENQCTVLGPAPCAVPKINYNFRYRLTVRCGATRQMRQLIAHLLRQFSQDKLNRGVNAFADVNGYD